MKRKVLIGSLSSLNWRISLDLVSHNIAEKITRFVVSFVHYIFGGQFEFYDYFIIDKASSKTAANKST